MARKHKKGAPEIISKTPLSLWSIFLHPTGLICQENFPTFYSITATFPFAILTTQ